MGEEVVSKNFIEQEIDKDLAEGVYTEVCTRFPPEQKNITARSICDSMIPIRPKRIWSL